MTKVTLPLEWVICIKPASSKFLYALDFWLREIPHSLQRLFDSCVFISLLCKCLTVSWTNIFEHSSKAIEYDSSTKAKIPEPTITLLLRKELVVNFGPAFYLYEGSGFLSHGVIFLFSK